MAQRQQQTARSQTALPPPLAAVNLHAAGIDLGADGPFVAVPPRDDPQPGRGFGACTADLEALAAWLATCGMTTIALASPGVYWLPLFALLATRGGEVLFVDPQPGQQSKGRPQRDRHDCPGRPRRHTCGLLAAALRPADQVGVWRSALRQRAMRLTAAAQHFQHMQKALTQMNVQLQPVVRDLPGGPGLALIRAIRAGERAPAPRAPLRDSRCQHDAATSARAVQGPWRDEQLFALAQALDWYEGSPRKIRECDDKIHPHVPTCVARSAGQPCPPSPRPRNQGRNQPAFAARAPRHRRTGGDLTQMEGIDETTAGIVLSEIGFDRRRWPPGNHCPAWLGLCPHHRVSGGKVLSRRTKPCATRAATALRLAAASRHHRQSAVGAFCRRLQARLGAPKALTAPAHPRARLIYSMLKHGTTSVRRGRDAYEPQSRQRAVTNLRRRAHELGDELRPTPEETAA